MLTENGWLLWISNPLTCLPFNAGIVEASLGTPSQSREWAGMLSGGVTTLWLNTVRYAQPDASLNNPLNNPSAGSAVSCISTHVYCVGS